jgi:PhnB protein
VYDPSRGYPIVVPCVLYDDPVTAAQWLRSVLGFDEVVRASLPDGWVGHIEVERDGFIILLGRRGGQFADASSITQVFVDDVAASCQRGVDEGNSILDEPNERPWGVRQGVVADPERQRWVLTQHLADTNPADWYGQILGPMPGSRRPHDGAIGPRHGSPGRPVRSALSSLDPNHKPARPR